MSTIKPSIECLKQLIAFPSVSSTSNSDVSDFVSEQLESLGFEVERTVYNDVRGVMKVNLVAYRGPAKQQDRAPSGLAYFCHTDVVPAAGWTGPGGDPFAGVLEQDRLYGRGACDMKGSLAAMLAAAAQISADEQTAPLWIVCTADEEVGFDGAREVVRRSEGYRQIVQAQPLAIIGEPTRLSVVHAHKGIIGFQITSRGRAAHSSTADGINANEAMVPMIQTLLELGQRSKADARYLDTRFDPPTLSWNFGFSDGGSAINVTPDRSVAWVSLRPMPSIDGSDLIEAAAIRARELGLEFKQIEGGAPVWIEPDASCIRDLCELSGSQPRTVCYGTDGGELAELESRVVIGPGDIAQAHTTDEWIEIEQLSRGIDLFTSVVRRWCTCGH